MYDIKVNFVFEVLLKIYYVDLVKIKSDLYIITTKAQIYQCSIDAPLYYP